ncbi:MAG: diguanylate cyclase domain-containing protein [Ramlibacter sp.]
MALAAVVPLCGILYKLYAIELDWLRSQAEQAQHRETRLAAEYARSRLELAAARLVATGDLAAQALGAGPATEGGSEPRYRIRGSSFWDVAGNTAYFTLTIVAEDGRRSAGLVSLEHMLRPAATDATLPRSYLVDSAGHAYPFGGHDGWSIQSTARSGRLLQSPTAFSEVDRGPMAPVAEGLAVAVVPEREFWQAAEDGLRNRFALGGAAAVGSGVVLMLLAGSALARAREQVGRTIGELERARHDAVTGLPGRALFLERAEAILRGVRGRNGFGVGVMYLDLDGFKALNDRSGHAHGDQVLKAVAGRLLHCIRETDAIGRIGGDEFAICFAAPMASLPELATLAAHRISADISSLQEGLSCSIGWAFSRPDSELADLLQEADMAMYAEKRKRRVRPPILQCA